MRIFITDFKKENKMECNNCWKEIERKPIVEEVYDTPGDNAPEEKYFCSEECKEEYLFGGDFAYFDCIGCKRRICEQNPAQGYFIQYRQAEDGYQICLRCYEEDILKNGCNKQKFIDGVVPGMFFSYGNPELSAAGYSEVPGFDCYFVNGKESRQKLCQTAIDLIESGYKVIVAYENLSTMGDEGYVTLYKKGDGDGKHSEAGD